MSDQKTVEAIIRGRVQGVWFRAWTEREANQRQLSGWVMNLRDGSVRALFHGRASAVDDMLGACWDGPPAAQVDAVEVVTVVEVVAGEDAAPADGFRVRR